MKFGTFYQLPCAVDQTAMGRYQDTIAQCQLAEELGFDAAWLAELHFNQRFSVMPAPMMIASAIAQITEKIRVGTAVHLVALHHPIRLAEEAATLDVLSGGRSIFGIGRGSIPTHFLGYGIDQEQARERFLEGLDIVLGLWANEDFSYEGRYHKAEGISVAPRPVQAPLPRVYIAANSADTFEIVGSLGHNILVAPTIVTVEGALSGLAAYRKELGENGHDDTKVRVNVNVSVHVAETEKEAQKGFQTTINNYIGTLRNMASGSQGSSRALSLTYETVRDEFAAVGTPEQVADKLHKFKSSYNPQEFMCTFDIGGLLPQEEVAKSMTMFAKEVMPQFQD